MNGPTKRYTFTLPVDLVNQIQGNKSAFLREAIKGKIDAVEQDRLQSELEKTLPASTDIDNPKFNKAGKVHDWRNYAGFVQDHWNELTSREKLIVIAMDQVQADREEWD